MENTQQAVEVAQATYDQELEKLEEINRRIAELQQKRRETLEDMEQRKTAMVAALVGGQEPQETPGFADRLESLERALVVIEADAMAQRVRVLESETVLRHAESKALISERAALYPQLDELRRVEQKINLLSAEILRKASQSGIAQGDAGNLSRRLEKYRADHGLD